MATWQYELADGSTGVVEADDLLSADAVARANDKSVVVVSAVPAEPTTAELRRAAYSDEADPLFFMSQRGECDQQAWLDKVQEIRDRYPYPE